MTRPDRALCRTSLRGQASCDRQRNSCPELQAMGGLSAVSAKKTNAERSMELHGRYPENGKKLSRSIPALSASWGTFYSGPSTAQRSNDSNCPCAGRAHLGKRH